MASDQPIEGHMFRILELLPGPEGSPLKSELSVSQLDSKPEFETLSYVWGEHVELMDIEVSGRQVQITTSLEAALRRLRDDQDSRALWIDQLCINQDDKEEKAAQVKIMRHIYSQCTRCLIWMGDLGPDELVEAEGAVNFIDHLSNLAMAEESEYESIDFPEDIQPPHAFLAAMRRLRTISVQEGPWWHRMWTVQEAILPPDKSFIWGPLEIDWNTMSWAANAWTSERCFALPDGVSEIAVEVGDIGHLIARIVWIDIATADLEETDDHEDTIISVVRWRDREATDPLDHVYALTGLHPPGSFPISESCNYNLEPARAYADFTVDLIGAHGLFPLVFDPYLGHEATENMPRWALDMRSLPEYELQYFHHYWGYGYYNANQGLEDDSFVYEPDLGTLDVTGSRVDVVKLVGNGHRRRKHEEPRSPPLPLLMEWAELYTSHFTNNNPSWEDFTAGSLEAFQDFCRLLIGDFVRNHEAVVERLATDEDVEEIANLLREGHESIDLKTIKGMTSNQTFFVTEKGRMGFGHLDTKPGDEVWVFGGGRMPFTVRPRAPTSEPAPYDFVGQCYVQGIMQGECFAEGTQVRQQTVRLH